MPLCKVFFEKGANREGGPVMDDNALAIFVLILAILFLLVIIMLTIVCIRQQMKINELDKKVRELTWTSGIWKF